MISWFQGEVKAEALNWNVSPSTCVVNKPGDSCRLEFEIELQHHLGQSACLFVDDTQLTCWSQLPEHFKWEITIYEPGLLSLQNHENKVLLSKKLEIKSIYPVKKRRRVRSPWSMF